MPMAVQSNMSDIKIDMAHESQECENAPKRLGIMGRLTQILKKSKLFAVMFVRNVWKLGKDDPRRVIHAIKVGLALSVVSLFYLMKPLFNGVGDNAIWAIMTVVVVLEFTAGATLSKGLNRGIGTLLAGSLGVSVGYLAEKAGPTGEAIIIGISVFILGAASTFSRFFPKIKRKYDYGVLIFLLTFNMITVSGYRVDNIFRMAYERLSTIGIGCGISLVISLLVCPIWAGEDLHRSIVTKFEGLVGSLEECMVEYFKGSECSGMSEDKSYETKEDPIYKGYKSILDSKASEESLANFASWEPGHGKFGFRHPWKQYVKVGSMLRHLAYSVVALHGCLRSEIQTPHFIRLVFRKPCIQVGAEVAQVMRELSDSIKYMKKCRSSESMVEQLHVAVDELNAAFHLQTKLLFQTKAEWHLPEEPRDKLSETAPDFCPVKIIDQEKIAIPCPNKTDPRSELFSVIMKELHPITPDGDDKIGTNSFLLSTYISPCPAQTVLEFAEVLPMATFASLVIEMVARLEHVIEAVQELGNQASFKP